MKDLQLLKASSDKLLQMDSRESATFRPEKAVASVVIPTRNRVGELRELLRSIVQQSVPTEVHVMDDGADDASAEMIRLEFPQVQYHRVGTNRGPAFQRNRGIELASCNLVFPVDDDALFVSPYTVEQTLAEFNHPRIAAVGIPYINIRQDEIIRQHAPDGQTTYVTYAFVGAAHAIRRDVFLRVGGFREHFFIMGEEGDLCVRMLNLGFLTRLGTADPIHHMESPLRDFGRMDAYGCRNAILFVWLNVPSLALPVHIIVTTVKCLLWSLTPRRFWVRLKGVLAGYRDCFKYTRKPVSLRSYLQFRSLIRLPRPLEEIAR
jgi:GT2 family glycosyltransferase